MNLLARSPHPVRASRRGLIVDLRREPKSLPRPEETVRIGSGPMVVLFGRHAPPLSTTLEWLEQAFALSEAAGRPLRVVSPPGTKSRRVLELLRFDRFMTLVGDVRSALRK